MKDTEHALPRRPPWLILFLLPLIVALPVLALAAHYNFDGLYGQDAYAYYDYAIYSVRHDLQHLRLPSPFFWPPGYPLLVALISFVAGMRPLAAQAVSFVAGMLIPSLVALLAFALWPTDEPRWAAGDDRPLNPLALAGAAGLLAALTPQLWQSSAVSMSDTTALAAATFGMWALLRYRRSRHAAMLALASAGLAFAMLTRMVYAALAVPAAAYALSLLARRPRRLALTHTAIAASVALFILAPLVTTFTQPPAQGNTVPFLGHLEHGWWRLRHALQNEFVTGNGNLQYRLPNGLYYALAPGHRYYFTPLLAPLLLPGLWRLWKERSLARLLLLLGWPSLIYLMLVGYPAQNFRFSLASLPPLAILVAVGFFTTMRATGRLRPLTGLLAAGALLWMAVGAWTLTETFIVRKQVELETVHWVQAHTAPQAQLLTFGITLAFNQYSSLDSYDLYHQTPDSIVALLQSPRPTYLLLDVPNVESQWAGHAPGENYQLLREHQRLQHLGDRRQYSLFQIIGAP